MTFVVFNLQKHFRFDPVLQWNIICQWNCSHHWMCLNKVPHKVNLLHTKTSRCIHSAENWRIRIGYSCVCSQPGNEEGQGLANKVPPLVCPPVFSENFIVCPQPSNALPQDCLPDPALDKPFMNSLLQALVEERRSVQRSCPGMNCGYEPQIEFFCEWTKMTYFSRLLFWKKISAGHLKATKAHMIIFLFLSCEFASTRSLINGDE